MMVFDANRVAPRSGADFFPAMKTIQSVLLYGAALLLLALPAQGLAQFTFTTNNGAITITGYTGPGGAVTIPGAINGWPVTAIGFAAFQNCASLTNVTVPNSVVSIGEYAFQFCNGLTNIAIGTNATSIGNAAFSDCASLSAITVAANNPAYRSVAGILFDRNQTTLIEYPQDKAGGSYTIPNSVTNIADYAFNYCASLTNVTISTNVTSIGPGTFSACTQLAGVTIPATVTSIGEGAFQDCVSLTDLNIPISVTNIGDFAFNECDRLASVTIPDSVIRLGGYAFAYCTTLTNIMIGANATSIGAHAFAGCPSLSAITVAANNPAYSSADGILFNQNQTTLIEYPPGKAGSSYTIPDGVTNIGAAAFESCGNLTSITIPASVTSMGDYAFAGGRIVINFTTPEIVLFFQGNAPSADSSVFNGQYNLTVYYLPDTTGWSSTFAGAPTTPWNPSLGLLQVTILPHFSMSAGAQWQVDNGTWQSSGTTMTNLALGNHTVSFSSIAGWTTPASQIVFVNSNDIATAVGTYVQIPFEYTTNDGAITITRYHGPGGVVSIPGTLSDLPVTSIGGNAFARCTPLTNVSFPDSVTNLGNDVFYDCINLTSVTVGANITGIGNGAFQQCASLRAITVTASNSVYGSVAGVLFNKRQTILIQYPEGKTGGSYSISNGVTSIGDYAFYDCASLTNITMPNSVTSIGNWAFTGSGLFSLTIPQAVTSLGYEAFQQCTNLMAITVAANNSAYGSVAGVLFSRDQTMLIQYPEAKAGLSYIIPQSVRTIADEAFGNCAHLTNVTIPNGVTNIGDFTFCACASLTSVTIPNGVTRVGYSVFSDCTSLTNVTISGTVTNLEDFAFASCPSLTEVYFLGNAPSADSTVFNNDNNVTVYYLPDTTGWSSTFAGVPTATWNPPLGSLRVTILPAAAITAGAQWQLDGGTWQSSGATVSNLLVGEHVVSFSAATGWLPPASQTIFVNSNQLAIVSGTYVSTPFKYSISDGVITITGYTGPGGAVTIPDTISGLPVTSIGYAAFQNCASLTNVTIPNHVVTIGDYAFQFCNNLTNAAIGTNVTSIGLLAFADCTRLASVTIPASVTNLGDIAFAWCSSLTAITVAANNPAYSSLAGILFNRHQTTLIEYPQGKAGGSYAIPNSVTNLGDYAFNNCSSLTNLALGTNLTSIGEAAFQSCGGLTSIAIPNGVTSIGDWAFQFSGRLTSVTIGASVTSIGQGAFAACGSLASVTIPASVTNLGAYLFAGCTSLGAIRVAANNPAYRSVDGVLFNQNQTTLITYPPGKAGSSYTIPNSVTNIGRAAFEAGDNLTSITIPASVVSLGDFAFAAGGILTSLTPPEIVLLFQGNAPSADSTVFNGQNDLAVYYLPDTTGWSSTFAGVPTTPWNPSLGLLQVTILPADANYAGAQWQVDDGSWRSSGAAVNNLSPGYHTVNFSPVTGWTTPASQTVFVSSNAIATATSTYVLFPFNYITNQGTITITGYTGPGGAVTIPDTINGLPVTSITGFEFGAVPGQPPTTIILQPPLLPISPITVGPVPIGPTPIAIPITITMPQISSVPIITNPIVSTPIPRVTTARLPITSVAIPRSVTNILDGVFRNCPGLTAITVAAGNPAYGSEAGVLFNRDQTELVEYPEGKTASSYLVSNSVTSIAAYAFAGCTNLTSVTIGSRVSSIGFDAFASCGRLAAFTVKGSNPAYVSEAGVLFNKHQTTLVQYPVAKAGTSYLIPGSVTTIGAAAFANCGRLTSVTMPGSVMDIGEGAFEYCTNLASTAVGSHVASIESYVFQGCTRLASVTIPESAINVGSTAFLNCPSLSAITVAANNPAYASVAGVWFNKKQTTLIQYPPAKAGTSYSIPSRVLDIGTAAFANCLRLTSVTIPNSVTNIGQTAFFDCTNLTSVVIGSGVASIGLEAFWGCASLSSITIPSRVTSIGDLAFWGCTNLRGVYFQGNAPNIDTNGYAGDIFVEDNNATAYYRAGTTGWGSTFGGISTALWNVRVRSDASLGGRANQFGFNLTGLTNQTIVVEACTNLFLPLWQPIQTNTLTGGSLHFSDPQWTNYPARFYRVRSP